MALNGVAARVTEGDLLVSGCRWWESQVKGLQMEYWQVQNSGEGKSGTEGSVGKWRGSATGLGRRGPLPTAAGNI